MSCHHAAAASGLLAKLGMMAVLLGGVAAPVGAHTVTVSTTGDHHNVSMPDHSSHLIIASPGDATFTGFSVNGGDPVDGDTIIVTTNVPTDARIRFAHLDTQSSAQYGIQTSSFNGDTISRTGMAMLVYSSDNNRWRLGVLSYGRSIAVPYDAANFAASAVGATWSVPSAQVQNFRIRQSSRALWVSLTIGAGVVGGAPTPTLYITVPGFWAFSAHIVVVPCAVNGVEEACVVASDSSTGRAILRRMNGQVFPLGAVVMVTMQIEFEFS